VTEINPRDSSIPADGMVLSGHGAAAEWIVSNVRVGMDVAVKDGRVIVSGDAPDTSRGAPFFAAVTRYAEAVVTSNNLEETKSARLAVMTALPER